MEAISSRLRAGGETLERIGSPSFLPRDEDVVEWLRSTDFDTRLQTLNRMIFLCKRDAEWFSKFSKKGELFKNLDRMLSEDRWEVQHECIRFLLEAIPSFGSNLEYCMCYVLPNLIPKLGSSKITVRRVTVQVMQTFTRVQPDALPTVLKMVINYVLTSPERITKHELLNELPALFQEPLRESNWLNLVDGLTRWMSSAEKETAERIALVLKKLEVFIGAGQMERVLAELTAAQQAEYSLSVTQLQLQPGSEAVSVSSAPSAPKSGERRFRFGIVPTYIGSMLTDEDANTKIAALEKLKTIIEKMTAEETNKLIPHLHSFFVAIGNVLNDLNFKVVVLSLDLLRLTVNRLKANIEAHLQQVVSLLSRHFGNQKAIVKQILMMTCTDLFRNLNPKAVVAVFCVFLEHRNSRVREEVINILTVALLSTPTSKMNLSAVANLLVPRLVDPKRRVRLAAFELLSVLAHHMNGKLEPIMKLVREYEEKTFEGLMPAVAARLKRASLPRIRFDGLLEYSTPPLTDTSFDVDELHLRQPEHLDLHWILYANGAKEEGGDSSSTTLFTAFKSGVKAALAAQAIAQQKALWETESDRGDSSPQHTLERIKSDDQIVRKGTAEKETAFTQNANSSTSSWTSPLKSDRISEKKNQLDNANFVIKEEARKHSRNQGRRRQKTNGELLRARSETTLSDDKREKENERPPPSHLSYDDTPIRPAKNDIEFESSPIGLMSAKSASHQSLPITSSHAGLRPQQSQPMSRKVPFLRAGGGSRVKPTPPFLRGPPPLAPKQMTQALNHIPSGPPSVSNALRKMESDDWNEKVDGITMISDLAKRNPQAVENNLTEVVNAILNECKNLRSSVSRAAISCMGELYVTLKSKMDPTIEKTTAVLMARSGDVSNAFIREDATEAIERVVQHGSPPKLLSCIATHGAKSKNNTIRTASSALTSQLLSRVGVPFALQNGDFLTRLIPLLIGFARDQTPKVRQHAKLALISLTQDPSYDRQMRKFVSEADYAAAREIMGDFQKKGGADSLDASSASMGLLSRNGSTRRSLCRKLPDSVTADLEELKAELTAGSWEKRAAALRRFEQMAIANPRQISTNTKLVEAFIGRLSDINSKVSLDAMNTYLTTLPSMARYYSSEVSLKAVLNQLLVALSSHLPSRSEDHRHLAQTSLEETLSQIDSAALSSPLASMTRKANSKQRPFLLRLLKKLSIDLHSSRPKQVEVLSLPVLWHCLQSPVAEQENKAALSDFALALRRLMGDRSFWDAATASLTPSQRHTLESLLR